MVERVLEVTLKKMQRVSLCVNAKSKINDLYTCESCKYWVHAVQSGAQTAECICISLLIGKTERQKHPEIATDKGYHCGTHGMKCALAAGLTAHDQELAIYGISCLLLAESNARESSMQAVLIRYTAMTYCLQNRHSTIEPWMLLSQIATESHNPISVKKELLETP